ncbi:MAG: DUF6335 family protein [Microcystaceae cyanobacterium]
MTDSSFNLQPETAEVAAEEVLLADLTGTKEAERIFEELVDREAGLEGTGKRLAAFKGEEAGVTGGDLDDDLYQAEVVGEEAVGGQNPTPDQNVTEMLEESMGLDSPDLQPIRTQDSLRQRDRNRWELDPLSSEDYQDRL